MSQDKDQDKNQQKMSKEEMEEFVNNLPPEDEYGVRVFQGTTDDPNVDYYKTVNDASRISPIFNPGNRIKIWYVKHQFLKPYAQANITGKLPKDILPRNLSDLSNTHTCLGSIQGLGTDLGSLEGLYNWMQGEKWSPKGAASRMIKELGLTHTSMSIGDAFEVDGHLYMVDYYGFKRLF